MGGQNRIVVNYGDYEGLILLAAYDNKTGEEVSREELENLDGFDIVKKHHGIKDFIKLKEMINDNQEGYVVRFKNGFRIKIKGDEYLRLHKILTNVSNRDIWEYLKDGKNMDEILDKVPDEFYDWVKDTTDDLTTRFQNIEKEYLTIFEEMIVKYPNRKDFAMAAKNYSMSSLLFSMLDERNYKLIIWKSLYPVYSKPFKKTNDE